jgi:predicted phage terminase large subunit-like protein
MSDTAEAYRKALIKYRCEVDFSYFIRFVFAEYYRAAWVHNWHHDEIIKVIYALERRDIPNAVINIPPRYGKTELIVILWICWTMIRNPRAQFIHASYSVDLALKNSAMVRDILKSPALQQYWPIRMRDSADSKGLWLTEEGGGMKSDSSAGAMTGFGAGITSWKEGEPFDGAIILDDPLKPDDAKSQPMREAVNERLSGTLHSRKNHSKVPMVIVMQRLHEEDPSGLALGGGVMGDRFHHLKLPALYHGKALWPFKQTTEALEVMQANNPEVFAGQYQQEPFVAKGEVYKLDWFVRYVALPQPLNRTMIVHSWDTAYKKGEHNDPSACTVWHVTPSLFYLAEVITGRWDYPELRQRAMDMARRDKPDAILIEDKASGQSLIQEMRSGTTLPVIAIEPEADKETRARTTAAMVQAGRVALPERSPWIAEYLGEIMAFPKGKHDDQVDSTSQFLRWVNGRAGDSVDRYRALLDSF